VSGRSAITRAFDAARRERRAAFVPFLVAGDPDLECTPRLVAALAQAGADVVELGVPFSDPIADGEVVQAASARALAAGATLGGVLAAVSAARSQCTVPIVLFSYFNPLLRYGLERFAEHAAASGVDGVLCLDLPPEEAAGDYLDALGARALDPIFLLAPTSTRERERAVSKRAAGFVYYVSRTGVTGERESLAPGLEREVARLRARLRLPLAVGFGISTAEQAAAVARCADGVVVGSALVRVVAEHGREPDLAERLARRAAELARATRGARAH